MGGVSEIACGRPDLVRRNTANKVNSGEHGGGNG